MARLVGLTGATGFIGKHLTKHLSGQGWRVRALTRRPLETANQPGVSEWIAGSLDNDGALERLVDGADAIVHCAGLIKARRRRDFERVNAIGTERLARITASSPSRPRFVLLSSLAAREPRLSAYAATKRQAEELAQACDFPVPVTILRPPAVYGPGDTETLAIYRAVKRGIAPLPGGDGGRLSLIHVADLAQAVSAILEAPSTAGRMFEVDDGRQHGYRMREMLEIVARILGVSPLFIPVPAAALKIVGALNLAAATLARYDPMLTPGKAREICHRDWVCRGGDLTRLSPWRPGMEAGQGLKETLSWYRKQNLL
ncbi:MAG: NAD-dependent epimerase/dehydratase family protein [Sphingomonadales bacterium]